MMQHLNENKWEVELPKMATDCSYCDAEAKPRFVLTPKVIATVRKLCTDIKLEWQMLLIGDETDDGIFLYDYYIPKQEVGAASVINKDEIDLNFVTKKKIICGIHSHGEIGVGWSNTDDECTNHSFIKNNIVTNNKGDYLAKRRIELPCGLVKFQDARVIMKTPEVKKIKGFDNIEERKYTYVKPTVIEYGDSTINWKRGNTRQHGYMYNQDKYQGKGGCYGF